MCRNQKHKYRYEHQYQSNHQYRARHFCHQCGVNKKLYQDEWKAREQQAYANEKGRAELSIYKCPNGDGWHLTSNTNSY